LWLRAQGSRLRAQGGSASSLEPSFYFVVSSPAQPAEGCDDDRGREALAHKILIEARVFGRVCRPGPSAQLLLQGAGDERSLVLLAEDLGDGFGCDLFVDAARQKFANDAQSSPALGFDRRARKGLSETLIVKAAGFQEAFDGRVDGVVRVLTGTQAIATLGDGVGATRQEMEGVEIGGGPVSSRTG
jgi:hypothetical protein